MRIHLKTLGCRLNEAELESWSRDFQASGHDLTHEPEQADLLVVNTCAVTEEAVRKSRKLLARTQRQNPKARLVVSGCYASLDPAASAKLAGVDLVVNNQDKERLVEIVNRQLNQAVVPRMSIEPETSGLLTRGRQRAFIKVQDGCRYRCTFCIVTLARGEERSRPITDVIDEINRLQAEGIQEVVLTGVHLGGYGSEIASNLHELISRVLEGTDIPRLRVGSLEPWDLPVDFWQLFQNSRFMPHLHLPLQSGSDRILRRMARRCRTDAYRRLIEQARSQVKDFNVTTDIIIGFPGETEDDWQQTLGLVQEIGFGYLHIFTYSPRDGTKAAQLSNPVSREVKRLRSETLHDLGKKMQQETLQSYLGRTLPVLVEGSGKSGWSGYTPNYLRVEIEAPRNMPLTNRIIDCRIESWNPGNNSLHGRARLEEQGRFHLPPDNRPPEQSSTTSMERRKSAKSS